MKTYKINNVEVNADQIRAIIKDNPELLEEKKGGRYFFPKINQHYWYINNKGEVCESIMMNDPIDFARIEQGVFETEEETILARDKQRAIVACWKWQQENAPFEPDWSDSMQEKWDAIFASKFKAMFTYEGCYQFTLPYFKSEKDCLAFIEANKEHLELLFTK
jgi:hypothetical protein